MLTALLGAGIELLKGHRADLARRRRLITEQVGGHGLVVVQRQVLGAVVQHRVHLVEHRTLGADAVLEEGRQVVGAPAALGQVLGEQAGGLVTEQHAALQPLILLQRAESITWRVAFAAVAQGLDQVLTALPGLAFAFSRQQLHAVLVEHVPEAQAEAHIEREAQAGLRAGFGDRLQAHQVGVDGVGVFALEQVIGGVRHGRIELAAITPLAFGHCAVEIIGAVLADAVLLVRGDVGAVDGAERRLQRQAAGVFGTAFDAVAGHTVGGARQVLAALDQLLISGLGGQRQEQGGSNQNGLHA